MKDRVSYAKLRIERLQAKASDAATRIRELGSRPITSAEHAEITELLKQRRSSQQAIKRWQKVLKEHD